MFVFGFKIQFDRKLFLLIEELFIFQKIKLMFCQQAKKTQPLKQSKTVFLIAKNIKITLKGKNE